MKQKLFNGYSAGLSATATRYLPVTGGGGVSVTEVSAKGVVPIPGTLRNLTCQLRTTPGAGSHVVTVLLDGSPTDLALTLGDTSVQTDASEVAVSAGQTLSYQTAPSGSPNAVQLRSTLEFEGTDGAASILLGNSAATALADNYYLCPGGSLPPTSSAFRASILISTPGTIRNLAVLLGTAPGAGKSRTFTVCKNGTPQTLAVTITGAGTPTTQIDTSHSFTVVAGDLVTIQATSAGGATASIAFHGLVFAPDTPGEYLIVASGAGTAFSATGSRYESIAGCVMPGSSETDFNTISLNDARLKGFCAKLSAAPSGGTTPTFTFQARRNNAGAITGWSDIAINDSTTNQFAAYTAATPFQPSNNDLFDTRCTPSGSPDTALEALITYTGWDPTAPVPITVNVFESTVVDEWGT